MTGELTSAGSRDKGDKGEEEKKGKEIETGSMGQDGKAHYDAEASPWEGRERGERGGEGL